ncbi:MAG: hypothetical protein GY756_04705 [bacterium]|nr:hypothetical protein [bacterium]
MKTITKKVIITFIALNSTWTIGIYTITYFFMKHLDFQEKTVVVSGIIISLFALFSGIILSWIKTIPIDKAIKNIKNLTDAELIRLSERTMNIPVYLLIIFIGIMFITYPLYYYTLRYFGFNPFASFTVFMPFFAGVFAVPPLMFFFTGFILRKTNIEISYLLLERNIKSSPKKISFQLKLFYAFGSSIIAITLWLICFGYYYHVNDKIDSILENYSFLQKSTVENIPDEIKNSNNINTIIQYAKNIELNNNGTVLLADTSGKMVYQSKDIDLYVKSREEVNTILKTDFKEQNSNMFYENITGNLICYRPLNKSYSIIYATNLEEITNNMSNFFYWGILFSIIAATLVIANIYIFAKWITDSVKGISELMLSFSNGDLTKRAGKNAQDETALMADSYNTLISKIGSIISEIQTNAQNLSNAGNQLSSISQNISQGAYEQASTTEEISSSMEEMLATISSNTEQACDTAEISSFAAKSIEKSKQIFTETINSVADISEKTLIITEIADKTDILSINAAIEAARAGKEGKGFAVVAHEVRKLSEKSKTASIEIEKLSKSGSVVSQKATETLDEIIPEIIKSAELVNHILTACKEQQNNAQFINDSLQQLTEITNENSATSQEMASSAEELSSQAEQLKLIVSVFNVEVSE